MAVTRSARLLARCNLARDDLRFSAESIRDLLIFVVHHQATPCAVARLDTRCTPWEFAAV